MKRRPELTPRAELTPWVVDYSEARAHAIKWLGDRYLLARPINANRNRSNVPPPALRRL